MNELMMTTGLANYSNTSVSAGPLQGRIPGGYPRCVNSEAKYSVFDVANWFLAHEAMTQKKLQKLCYYAQAWFYALKNQRLMNTEFQAWVHGPVSPVLYACFKSFGFEKIKIKGTLKFPFSDEDTAFLNRVWETYGGKTGNALEALSHHELSWQEARRGYGEFERCSVAISPASMRDFYNSIRN